MDTGGLKCYVLILSTCFRAEHPSAGEDTLFAEKLNDEMKIHTIRNNYELWKNRAHEINSGKAYLSVRQWSGKPYHSKQVELKKYFKLGIEHISMHKKKGNIHWQIESSKVPYLLFEVAQKDGLEYADFLNCFFPDSKDGLYEGAILHFTDFRYTDPNKQVKS